MRWFVSSNQWSDNTTVCFDKNDFHYLTRVRRVKVGEVLDLIVDKTIEKNVKIMAIEKDSVTVKVLNESEIKGYRGVEVTLIQGLPKQDKFSDLLNSNTQIGVSRFIPVITKRSVVVYDEKQRVKKKKRWLDIIQSASQQSYSLSIPELSEIVEFNTFLEAYDSSFYELSLVAWEDEKKTTLKTLLNTLSLGENPLRIAVFIGPEGGVSSDEVDLLLKKGFISVSLGSTILRTETAGLVACSNIQYHFL